MSNRGEYQTCLGECDSNLGIGWVCVCVWASTFEKHSQAWLIQLCRCVYLTYPGGPERVKRPISSNSDMPLWPRSVHMCRLLSSSKVTNSTYQTKQQDKLEWKDVWDIVLFLSQKMMSWRMMTWYRITFIGLCKSQSDLRAASWNNFSTSPKPTKWFIDLKKDWEWNPNFMPRKTRRRHE